MKKLMIIAAAAALFAGCGSEAEKFGYKGADLKDDSEMFFSTGPTVTNWVPARVLGVVEKYPITEAEAAIIKEAGIIDPGAPLETIPEGYEKRTEEPWFTVWAKNDVEHFGFKGSNGFVAHYNDEKNVWETGETYFSSYYDDEAPALETLAEMRKVVAKGYAPKRFWVRRNRRQTVWTVKECSRRQARTMPIEVGSFRFIRPEWRISCPRE